MKRVTYEVPDMCCATEAKLVESRLGALAGVERLNVNVLERKVTVEHTLDDARDIQTALESIGLPPRARPASTDAEPKASVPWERILMAVSGMAAVAAEAVAWTTHTDRSPIVVVLALLSIVAGGREPLRKGIAALRSLTLNINFLMSLAVLGAAAIGQWPEAAMVTFLFGLAEAIEDLSLDRARNAIRGLMEMSPEEAEVRDENGGWHRVDASDVAVGATVRVRPGERVPLDGTVTAGGSTVNQAPITGESVPVEKSVGDAVFAGTVNERGSFEFRVTANEDDTTLARIVRTVEEAQAQKAPTERFIDRFARVYTPTVVALATLVAILPPLLFAQPFADWLYRALVLLVIACPCALVISTPVTVVSGLAAAARQGILIKGGSYLEEGRKLTVVALDKTGTLTKGAPALTDVVPLVDEPPERLLLLAASVDAPSEHPVASAIVAAHTKGALLPVEGFESITGRGAKGRVEGRELIVGNHRLTEETGVCGPHVERELARLEAEGKTAVVLATHDEALAVFGVADTLRETSVQAVREMHALGLRTVMLTGDNPKTAEAIARQVGIDDARGGLLPEDKLRAVESLLQTGAHVGMVGDGINDAPALARAGIGFAMGAAGADAALETADVALMQDDLRKLPEFVCLSRRAGAVLRQNIAAALGIKVVFFALALTGHATLWMAVFADLGGSLLVVANGLRILRFRESRSTSA